VLALGAGALGGFMVLFQKISTSAAGRAAFVGADRSARLLQAGLPRLPVDACPGQPVHRDLDLALSAVDPGSATLLQHGHAIRLIPSFNAPTSWFRSWAECFILGEPLHPLQWAACS